MEIPNPEPEVDRANLSFEEWWSSQREIIEQFDVEELIKRDKTEVAKEIYMWGFIMGYRQSKI